MPPAKKTQTTPKQTTKTPTKKVSPAPRKTTTTPSAAPTPQKQSAAPTIVTILLLIFFNLIGVIVMWFWPKWETWVKVLVTVLSIFYSILVFGIFSILATVVLIAINPQAQMEKAQCVANCSEMYTADSNELQQCKAFCVDPSFGYPTEFKQEFMQGCLLAETDPEDTSTCDCMWQYFAQQLPYAENQQLFENPTKEFDNLVLMTSIDAGQACK